MELYGKLWKGLQTGKKNSFRLLRSCWCREVFFFSANIFSLSFLWKQQRLNVIRFESSDRGGSHVADIEFYYRAAWEREGEDFLRRRSLTKIVCIQAMSNFIYLPFDFDKPFMPFVNMSRNRTFLRRFVSTISRFTFFSLPLPWKIL